jgi:N-acetylmuramoyl-L-alanine amidase
VVSALGQDIGLLQNPDRHAGFMVLKAADIPSVLVEMGFMSNFKDETELRQQAHRARVTQSMANAVDAWYLARQSARMAG